MFGRELAYKELILTRAMEIGNGTGFEWFKIWQWSIKQKCKGFCPFSNQIITSSIIDLHIYLLFFIWKSSPINIYMLFYCLGGSKNSITTLSTYSI